MDHFNATVHNGHLVHTRRGLQVSKQKFNGLSFVNSYPQTFVSENPTTRTKKSSAPTPQREFKFVSKSQEPKAESKRRTRKSAQEGEVIFTASNNTQTKKSRKRRSQDELLSTASPAASSVSASTSTSDSSSSRLSSEASSPVLSDGLLTPPFFGSHTFDGLDTFGPTLGSLPMGRLSTAAWATPVTTTLDQAPGGYMSAENRKLFHHYFAYVPRSIYPYEDILTYNPIKSSDFYYMVIKDLAALHCVLMTGSVAEMLCHHHTPDFAGFSYHITKICAILNQKLRQDKGVDSVTVECILVLALLGSCVGRLDYWYMHMQGLQKVIEMNGGLGGLGPALVSKIHKTDLKGAVALATTPYIPFTRSFAPVSTIVPPHVRNEMTGLLTEHLSALRISPVTITSLTNLSVFTAAVRLARYTSNPSSTSTTPAVSGQVPVAYDPHAFTDELHAVTYDLLVQPMPLRDPSTTDHGPYNPFNPPVSAELQAAAAAMGLDEASAEEYYGMANHRLHAAGGIIAPSPLGEGGHLEPALRIAGLLFLKELLPDWPRNVGGYAVLLNLLTTHVQGIIDTYQPRYSHPSDPLDLDASLQLSPDFVRNLNMGLHENDLANLDPALFSAASQGSTRGQGAQQSPSVRPAVLWLCVFGYLVALLADKNEGRTRPDEQYERGVFGACLRDVAGVCSEDDVACLTDQDLVFFRLLDLRNLQGDNWDDRTALQALVAEASLF